MICASVPSVHLRLRVPVGMPNGGGWAWGALDALPGDLGSELALNARECQALVQTYGRTMTRVLSRAQLGDRFRVCAWGRTTGLIIGMREWAWSTSDRDYVPVGEYLCGWREALRSYWQHTGELFDPYSDSYRRMANAVNDVPHQLHSPPYVRHREDVPHEHALPDLYGLRSA